jgi:glutathione synthase/RimK-type ligase-like ATP-grasp enzyme
VILIVTSKVDAHVNSVTCHLDAARFDWVRINTEDVASNVNVVVSPAERDGEIFVRDSGRQFRLSNVVAVWYRKPTPAALSHFALEPRALEYVKAEFNETLLGLYSLLGKARWINYPMADARAHRKLVQLAVARESGFRTPRTIVTNDPAAALRFADEVQGDLAIKSLGAISVTQEHGDHIEQYGLFTRRVTKQELAEHIDKIQYLPCLIQEYVPKQYELRVTCVGDRVFACRIDSQCHPLAADDYRFATKQLRHKIVECEHLRDPIRAYMDEFGLHFGCFDFAVTPTGSTVFFEMNPNGQWLWVERKTGAQIGQAIAHLLMGAY